MPFANEPLDSPYRKKISLSAMITCAKVQFGLGVLLMVFQVPASGFTYYESLDRNLTTNTFNFHPITLFYLDCWFPGIFMGILAILCARFQFQKYTEAVSQITDLHREGDANGERPKWAGLVLPRGRSFALLFCSSISAYGLLLANGLGFGLANQLHQNNPEISYEKTVFLIFFHVAVFVCSVPTFALILTGMSNLTIVTGHCCSWVYPYPVYLDFSERSRLIGVYGPKFQTTEDSSSVSDSSKL